MMKKMRKWFCTVMSAIMLICCYACNFPETPTKSEKPEQRAPVTVAQQETKQTTTTAAENSFADKEARIEYPRPTGKQNISVGSKGDDVCWVQAALNKTINAGINVDGDFGNTTRKYVKEFQNLAGLTPDGSVGPKTIEKLAAVASGKENLVIVTTEKNTTARTTTTRITEKKSTDTTRYTPKTTVTTTRRTTTYTTAPKESSGHFILNTGTMKIHLDGCRDISKMDAANKKTYSGSYQKLLSQGYTPCGHCHPNKYVD